MQDISGRLVLAATLVLAPAVFRTALSDRLPLVGYLTTTDVHFIFIEVYILACCLVQTGMRILLNVGVSLEQVGQVNEASAVAFVAVLFGYHFLHFYQHYAPYMKRLSMFEKRSFYAPPVVTNMEMWKAPAKEESSGLESVD